MSDDSATARKLAACVDDNRALWARVARLEARLKASGVQPVTVEAALHCLIENRIKLADIPKDVDYLDVLDVVTALNGIVPDLKAIRARAKRE